MNNVEIMERRAEVLMRQIELNSKKLRQQKLKENTWNTHRLEATLKIMPELKDISQMINQLWEYPDRT